jgi:proteasome lid subunit RPN8/RPN11
VEKMTDRLARNLMGLVKGRETEVCGYLLGDENNLPSFLVVPNVAPRPETSFFMDPQRQLEVVQQHKDQIFGVFHSHPQGSKVPSPDDMSGWHPSMPWRYFIVTGDAVCEYERDGDDVTCVFEYP